MTAQLTRPSTYLKAILAGFAAGAALLTGLADGGVTLGEWAAVAGATVGGFNLVFWPGNAR